jgi:hypothetical protein
MSNKQFRQPANPEYKSPALDPSTPGNPSGDTPADTPPAGDPAPAVDPANPFGLEPPPYNGKSWTDLRFPIRTKTTATISDEEAAHMLAVCDRFCAQIVEITTVVLESIPNGEVRRIVAADTATAPCIVTQDGKALGLRDAPIPAAEPSKRPRGSSHPLITLIKLAMQAVKALKRTLGMTHPKVVDKRDSRIKPEQEKTYDQVYKEMGQYLRVT